MARLEVLARGWRKAAVELGQQRLDPSVQQRPEDLIAYIKPIDRRRLSRNRFAVFFVTPSFATWLLDDGVFLQKALRQVYAHILEQGQMHARIHALCAVVDKLPAPSPILDVENIENVVSGRIKHPPVSETGHEGIAYATLRLSDSIPASSSTVLDKAAISFIASEGSDHEGGHWGDALRLPLANTVFQTGSPSTMTYSTWEKASGANELTLKDKQDVTHHGVRIRVGGPSTRYTSTLSVPLVPLSMPREVGASMGNILRRLISEDGTSITASQELEKFVPQYFASRGEPSQATTVWALVMRPDILESVIAKTTSLLYPSISNGGIAVSEDSVWENFWKQDPPIWSDLVPAALASGARLHRVLSGGGGWGKKAGLLSLDPVPTFEAEYSSSDSNDFDFDEPGTLSSALQQVARDGDYIQFFMSPSCATKELDPLNSVQDASKVWGWEFGTIPSTTDSMPAIPGQMEASTPNNISVFRHTFGALAEGGMVINRNVELKSEDSISLVGGSTIDVPFSRFSALSWTTSAKGGTEEDSIQNCLESKPVPYHRVLVRELYGTEASSSSGLRGLSKKKKQQPRGEVISNNLQIQRPSRLIRYYALERDELAYCVDSLRRVDRKVARFTQEYRTLMHQIRTQNSLPMDAALRKPKRRLRRGFVTLLEKMQQDLHNDVADLTHQYQTLMATIPEQSGRRVGLRIRKSETTPATGFMVRLANTTSQSEVLVNAFTKDIQRVPDQASRNRNKIRYVSEPHISSRQLTAWASQTLLYNQRKLDSQLTKLHAILARIAPDTRLNNNIKTTTQRMRWGNTEALNQVRIRKVGARKLQAVREIRKKVARWKARENEVEKRRERKLGGGKWALENLVSGWLGGGDGDGAKGS
ncbi:hypothetical protein N0V90_001224 [Kalmusia sp. IMI 367209]|nr:hypothetical protein N0V90_001224 [Kalmusia sp. IMI 367209]